MVGQRLIALDIGNKTTKIVYGLVDKKNIIINEYAIINTPVNCVNDGIIINAEELSRTLLEVFKKNNIKGGSLVVNVTGTGVITRDIRIPESTEQEIAQILEFEAQQYFPVDLENYTIDFKVLEEIKSDEGIQLRVLIVAATNKQVEGYIQLSKLLKKALKAIDIPANCILKVLSYQAKQNLDTDGEYAVVDLGKDTSLVCIFQNNSLKFNRILLNGSAEIDSNIANKFNLEYRKAEELKLSFNGFTETQIEAADSSIITDLGDVIKNAIDNIISDINRFIDFYNSRESMNHVSKIYICGGGSKLTGLAQYFSSYFNMPVLPITLSKGIIYKGSKGKIAFEEDYIQLINAIGGLVRT